MQATKMTNVRVGQRVSFVYKQPHKGEARINGIVIGVRHTGFTPVAFSKYRIRELLSGKFQRGVILLTIQLADGKIGTYYAERCFLGFKK